MNRVFHGREFGVNSMVGFADAVQRQHRVEEFHHLGCCCQLGLNVRPEDVGAAGHAVQKEHRLVHKVVGLTNPMQMDVRLGGCTRVTGPPR